MLIFPQGHRTCSPVAPGMPRRARCRSIYSRSSTALPIVYEIGRVTAERYDSSAVAGTGDGAAVSAPLITALASNHPSAGARDVPPGGGRLRTLLDVAAGQTRGELTAGTGEQCWRSWRADVFVRSDSPLSRPRCRNRRKGLRLARSSDDYRGACPVRDARGAVGRQVDGSQHLRTIGVSRSGCSPNASRCSSVEAAHDTNVTVARCSSASVSWQGRQVNKGCGPRRLIEAAPVDISQTCQLLAVTWRRAAIRREKPATWFSVVARGCRTRG